MPDKTFPLVGGNLRLLPKEYQAIVRASTIEEANQLLQGYGVPLVKQGVVVASVAQPNETMEDHFMSIDPNDPGTYVNGRRVL